ncbi:response regulator [Chitinophaga ginsengisoli]|uniref:CheY-like chemotaxis protein n=1 Tax=Chitinophaga ginsengisoli TaxID=363837 RepID=A0A2P8G587_9BACT|nr:response regulator [Chitinophaga ginsengisoli]PSL29055.1 CheY-like chemotaxis protein [Chitinophaga ginsengisoli]
MSDIFLPVILMLEHDPDDRFLTSTVFEEQQYQVHLEFLNNSKGLFSYLDECRRSNLPYPAVILINLNITPLDGREVLKQLKANADYRHLPVVILSESKDQKLARECYALGASSFIQKPDALSGTSEKIHNFFKYWFETVVLA